MTLNYAIATGELCALAASVPITCQLRGKANQALLILGNLLTVGLLGPSALYQINQSFSFPIDTLCAGIALASGGWILGSSRHIGQWLARMLTMAQFDQLTGAYNRHVGYRLLESSRTQDGLLLIDIDHFKQFNTNYGHSGGDQVLKIVCDRIRQALSLSRRKDYPIRWGGDEILVVVRGCSYQQTLEIAARIIEKVRQPIRLHNQLDLAVTVSIGVTIGSPEDSVERKLERVDRAASKAKSSGRDCYCGEWPSGRPRPI